MSYDEDISSAEAVNKLNERAQAKLNAGIYESPIAFSLPSLSSGIVEHTINFQDLVPLLFSVREAYRRPVQVLVRRNDPSSLNGANV